MAVGVEGGCNSNKRIRERWGIEEEEREREGEGIVMVDMVCERMRMKK